MLKTALVSIIAVGNAASTSDYATNPDVTLQLQNKVSQFFTVLGFGTPPQFFPMLLDTGSEKVWIPGPECKNCDRDGKTFQYAKSITYDGRLSEEHTAGYASGQISYREMKEVVTCVGVDSNPKLDAIKKEDFIERSLDGWNHNLRKYMQNGNLVIDGDADSHTNADNQDKKFKISRVNLTIGLTDHESNIFHVVPFDGIVGMSPEGSQFVNALYENKNIQEKQVGINLHPDINRMFLGKIPSSTHIQWEPNSMTEYWSVDNAQLYVFDLSKKDYVPLAHKRRLIMDTGSSVAMLSNEAQKELKAHVPCNTRVKVELPCGFIGHLDVYAETRGSKSNINIKNLDTAEPKTIDENCDLDVMDMNNFGDLTIVIGKDWFERHETWFNWERSEIGFARSDFFL